MKLTVSSTKYLDVGTQIDVPIRNNGFWLTLWCFIVRKPAPREYERLIITSIDSPTTLTVERK